MTKTRAILLLLIFGVAAFLFVQLYPGRRISRNFNSQPIASSQPLRSQAISIRFSPDNKYLLVAGSIGKGSLGRYQNGEYLFDFKNQDKRLRLFDVAKEKEIERLKAEPIFGQWNGYHMLVMPDFKTLVTSWGARTIHVMDVRKRKPEKIVDVRNGYLSDIKLSPDGKILILGMTAEVQFRDSNTFKLLRTYNHGGQGTNIDLGKSSRIIRCRWSGMKPHYVDVKTAKRISTPRSTREFDVTFSPDGKYFVDTTKGNIEIWQYNPKSSFKIGNIKRALVRANTVQFSPDNKIVAVGGLSSTENPIRFYKLSDIRASKKPL